MTGFMPTLLQNGIGESFEETLSKVVEANAAMKKDGFAGLSGIPLLGLAYKIFWVDCLATLAIKIGYRNPLLQMSNIGILRDENAPFEGCKLVDCFITGAVKYKPYFQLTCLTHDNHLRFCVAERCSKADEALIEAFLDDLLEELKEYARR